MNRKHSLAKQLFLLAVDTLCNGFAFYFASLMRFGAGYLNYIGRESFIEVILIIALISFAIHIIFDQSVQYMHRTVLQELQSIILYNIIFIFTLIITLYLIHHAEYLSRLQMGYFVIINILLMFSGRLLAKTLARQVYHSDNIRTNVVLIVQSSNLSEVMHRFTSGVTYHICGIIVIDEDHKAIGTVNHVNIESTLNSLTSDLVQYSFDEVFICLPDYPMKDLEELITGIEDMGAVCHYSLSASNQMIGKGTIGIFGDYPVVSYAIKSHNPYALMIKRMFDVLGAIVGLLITAVLTLFLAPAIKLDSPGPVFFAQTRVGKNGRKFKFWKFRSMVSNAESLKLEMMKDNEMSSTLMFKIKKDPRITRVGKFIRKTSLDEFPQFWNVLTGDMSLVGTRPPTVEEYEQYDEHYRRRLSMAPGITGLWQVSGRSSITDFNEVVKLDLEYIDNWSLKLDLQILLKTFSVVFHQKGAT